IVRVGNDSAFGSTVRETNVASGAAIELGGGRTMAEPLVIAGSGFNTIPTGVLRSTNGSNTWSGLVSLTPTNTQVGIGVDAGSTLCMTGVVQLVSGQTGVGILKLGGGTLEFGGSLPNTFTGTTTVRAGTLNLNKTPGLNAIAGPLVVGDDGGGTNA